MLKYQRTDMRCGLLYIYTIYLKILRQTIRSTGGTLWVTSHSFQEVGGQRGRRRRGKEEKKGMKESRKWDGGRREEKEEKGRKKKKKI